MKLDNTSPNTECSYNNQRCYLNTLAFLVSLLYASLYKVETASLSQGILTLLNEHR